MIYGVIINACDKCFGKIKLGNNFYYDTNINFFVQLKRDIFDIFERKIDRCDKKPHIF